MAPTTNDDLIALSHQQAAEMFPGQTEEVLSKLHKRLAKARKPLVGAGELDWWCTLTRSIAMDTTSRHVCIHLVGRVGRRMASAVCGHFQPEDLPAFAAAHLAARPLPELYPPHVCTLWMREEGPTTSIHRQLAYAGFVLDGVQHVLSGSVHDTDRLMIWTITESGTDSGAAFVARVADAERAGLMATPPGEVWLWERDGTAHRCTRMDDAALAACVGDTRHTILTGWR